jgi:hypothetical protein
MEWLGFWAIEAEAMSDGSEREPTQDELGQKIFAWAQKHNATYYARQGEPVPEMKRPGWAGG